MTGSWDKTLKVCCVTDGLCTVKVVLVPADAILSSLLPLPSLLSVLGYPVIKSYDGLATP